LLFEELVMLSRVEVALIRAKIEGLEKARKERSPFLSEIGCVHQLNSSSRSRISN
jgi:hypothetical protein